MILLSRRITFFGFLLIVAVGLSYWSLILSGNNTPPGTKPKNQIDAYMEKVTAITLNKLGTPSLKVETPRVVHFTDEDASYIIRPHVTIYRNCPNPWHVNSHYATTKNGTNEITFFQDVIIHHELDTEQPTTTLTTNTLTVLPNEQLVKTNDAVTIIQPGTVVHGTGMLANLNDGTVELLSNAKGDYVPT